MKRKLTTRSVRALESHARLYDVYDSDLQGFYVRVFASGAKTFAVRYRFEGQQRRLKIGRYDGGLTVDQARKRAAGLLGQVRTGRDPAAESRAARQAPTFASVAERYMEEHAKPSLKPRTVEGYETLLRLHLRPHLGKVRIHTICRRDVAAMHRSVGKSSKYAANRALELCSAVLNFAHRDGLRGAQNPCSEVRSYREKPKERFLTPAERARLRTVLEASEEAPPGHPDHIAPGAVRAFRLLALTGARRSEITELRWGEVDLRHGVLRLSDSKTGPKVVPLSDQAQDYLREWRPRNADPRALVCQSATGRRLSNLGRAWASVKRRAKLEDVRIHDLRHSMASDALAAGVPLELIGGILGHRSLQTTRRYSHLADTALRDAVQRAGEAIEQAASDGANVVELRRAR